MISNTVTSLRIVLLAPLWLLMAAGGDEQRFWALATFLAAGLTDVFDGFLARRLGEASAFGAMLDLIADRLLTLVTLVALVAFGGLGIWGVVAGLVLIARDVIVASFNEAQPGRLAIRVSLLERVKITFQFLAFGLLIAPEFFSFTGLRQHQLGEACLCISAALCLATLGDYSARVARAFRVE